MNRPIVVLDTDTATAHLLQSGAIRLPWVPA